MRVYTAPEVLGFKIPEKASVFLAGSIEQDRAEPWQNRVIETLKHLKVAVFNPRRETWNASAEQSIENPDFYAQVTWELDHIEDADVMFFYFQPDTLSPISMAELGFVLGLSSFRDVLPAQKIIVVCPRGFWRRGNVEIMCERAGAEFFEDLTDGLNSLTEYLEHNL